MRLVDAIKTLARWKARGRSVFSKHDLRKLFPNDQQKTFDEGLRRLVKGGVVERACRGIYVTPDVVKAADYLIEHIAKQLRKGEYSYISLETMLAEYGAISQIPIDRLTVITTGRRGVYQTTYGVIEFTHTKRSIESILQDTIVDPQRPLRLAKLSTAKRDLLRVGRNKGMLDE